MATVLDAQYLIKKKGSLSTQSHPIILKSLDPTQGFNIKTDFPKMENKNKQRQQDKKQESHLKQKQQ